MLKETLRGLPFEIKEHLNYIERQDRDAELKGDRDSCIVARAVIDLFQGTDQLEVFDELIKDQLLVDFDHS